MVTSNKLPEKVVTMAEEDTNSIVPQRALREVNEYISCPLCRGYYIDATTIVECLHSFCRSCIIKHLQVKSYCPVCEMMINSAKPNIKLDKALQDIVYKLVPGLFQKEMERRQLFYASRPGPAASATPEQRGEDTERIIFSPEDVISFSLEYAEATDSDSISSKSSDSNEAQPQSVITRRYLQCPAVVNISHLKKFLIMKFDIDSSQFDIDILYKRVPLPDYYTLMDIAYIFNWKRNEPLRFFYQIIDNVAIHNRLFDINRKRSHFRDRKPSPTLTEDTNVSSPAPNLNDHNSEPSSGTDSPMPDDSCLKQANETFKKEKSLQNKESKDITTKHLTVPGKNDEEVEKSEFLNSFELKAKNYGNDPSITSPSKANTCNENIVSSPSKSMSPKSEDTLKRKHQSPQGFPEMKKLKIEIEKAKLPDGPQNISAAEIILSCDKTDGSPEKSKESGTSKQKSTPPQASNNTTTNFQSSQKETKQHNLTNTKPQQIDGSGVKRPVPSSQNTSSPKRRNLNEMSSNQNSGSVQKLFSPHKPIIPKLEPTNPTSKPSADSHVAKPSTKKIPDLKPGIPSCQSKAQPVSKVRMDLLANNCDPTIDRSKILSQVKSSLSIPSTSQSQASGNPLKSLFDSCKLSIPKSLSITLTDQKQDASNLGETSNSDSRKNVVQKNIPPAPNVTHNVATPSPHPPVHNYIEILKLPETESKKQSKTESNADNKVDPNSPISKPPKSESAKGPVPNLKPIADTKLAKQSGSFSTAKTFQQQFEQQLQSLQTDSKQQPKLPKNKSQVPKLVPAATAFAAAKLNPNNKPNTSGSTPNLEPKSSTALDLSTAHNLQSQLTPLQSKAFETMQSIAYLAKKQNLPGKTAMQTPSQNFSGSTNRPPTTSPSPLRIPVSNVNKPNFEKSSPSASMAQNSQEILNILHQIKSSNTTPNVPSSFGTTSSNQTPVSHPSPRTTRSPSSSPKLVIAEDKQGSNPSDQNANQSNQITSTQQSKSEPKPTPGPSKQSLKPPKPVPSAAKFLGMRQPITPNIKPNQTPSPTDLQFMSHHAHQALLRHQIELNAWMKAQRQLDLFKMSNIAHQAQNDLNKDKH